MRAFSGPAQTITGEEKARVNDMRLQAGGGWVHDSTPEGEFQETVNKSQAMRHAIALAEGFGREPQS